MTKRFPEQMKEIPGHRVVGMVTYRLDEILLATLAGSYAEAMILMRPSF